jgi:hypothetical protein
VYEATDENGLDLEALALAFEANAELVNSVVSSCSSRWFLEIDLRNSS